MIWVVRMWCCVFLWISVGTAAALGCDWLPHFTSRTNACLKKLRQMEGAVDVDVSPQGTGNDGFNQLYRCIRCQHKTSQLAFVQENLKGILHLYRHGNLSRLGWNADPFLSTLASQIDRLQPCVSHAFLHAVSPTPRRCKRRHWRCEPRPSPLRANVSVNASEDSAVSRYYSELLTSVRTNGGLASWKRINHLTRRHLHRLDMLVHSVRGRRYRRGTATGSSADGAAPERTTAGAAPERTTNRRIAPGLTTRGCCQD